MATWRQAAVDDPAARALLDEYFADRAATFPPELGEYRPTHPEPAAFTPPRGLFLVVEGEAGEGDVGCGGVRRIDAVDAGALRFEVKHIWLQPRARGRGLGRALLAELERRAVELGATELVLDTNASLTAAGGLYRSSGYVEIAPYNENPNATHWYRKAL